MSKRKAITRRQLEEVYEQCLERERDRERKYKLSLQGAFETFDVLHFDQEAEEDRDRDRSSSWLSDRGKGAEAIRSFDETPPDPVAERKKRIDRAKHLVQRKAPECLKVFWLILKNGSNRKESIWELMKLKPSKRQRNGTRQARSIGTT